MEVSLSTSGFKLLKKALYILVLVVLIDQGLGRWLAVQYDKQVIGQDAKASYVMNETEASTIILGASKAHRNYDPSIFSSSLGGEAYNAGRNGQSLLYHYSLFHIMNKRYVPDRVILDINPHDVLDIPEHYDRLSVLLPYADQDTLINSLLLSRRYERLKLLSEMYPYNSMILSILNNMTVTTVNSNGYSPHRDALTEELLSQLRANYKEHKKRTVYRPLDDRKLLFLNEMIGRCDRENIQLYLVLSPLWDQNVDMTYPFSRIARLARKHNVPVIDLRDGFTDNMSWFYDQNHLNETGAQEFSAYVAKQIKAIEDESN